MSCKHGTPSPGECFWTGAPPRCLQCEIEQLQSQLTDFRNIVAEVAEVKAENRAFRKVLESLAYNHDIEHRGPCVANWPDLRPCICFVCTAKVALGLDPYEGLGE